MNEKYNLSSYNVQEMEKWVDELTTITDKDIETIEKYTHKKETSLAYRKFHKEWVMKRFKIPLIIFAILTVVFCVLWGIFATPKTVNNILAPMALSIVMYTIFASAVYCLIDKIPQKYILTDNDFYEYNDAVVRYADYGVKLAYFIERIQYVKYAQTATTVLKEIAKEQGCTYEELIDKYKSVIVED